MDWRDGHQAYRYSGLATSISHIYNTKYTIYNLQHYTSISEYPLYPGLQQDEELGMMERAITFVTNNIGIATVSIPVILLGQIQQHKRILSRSVMMFQ